MIDIHSHVVPNDLPFGLHGDPRWPSVVLNSGKGSVVIDGRIFRVVREVSWNMGPRIEEVERRGITVQVISPMPELFCYWAPPQECRDYCKAMNEWIADKSQSSRGKIIGLGIVPMQDLNIALSMLDCVRALGLAGVEIGSNIAGVSTGHVSFSPFYEEASRLGLSVFIHSFHPAYEDQVPKFAVNGVTFPLDVGFVAEALIVNKIFATAPNLRVGLSHGGGTAAFAISRLQFLYENSPELREALGESPLAGMKRMYYDSILLARDPLQYLINVVGVDRVCIGTDFPFFGSGDVLRAVHELDLPADQVEGLFAGNAKRFLGIA